MNDSVGIALSCIAGLLGLAPLAVALARNADLARRVTYGLTAAVCAALATLAFVVLAGRAPAAATTLPLGLPWIGAHFRLDALAAFFLVVVNLGGAVAGLYGLGYGRHETVPGRVQPFVPAFLAAMNLVVLADDAFTFLLCWEFMSLSSWALVMAHHRLPGNARAGYVYLAMASFGTLALLLAFGLMAGPLGNYTFEAIRAADHTPLAATAVLGLLLLGAGSKAGLVPLHVWLPLAHPAAPSHVSALMSGVMTKVAVYACVRVLFDLLGDPAWWAAIVMLFVGGVTATVGILHAMMETDSKRLLAYSTIENVGVIFVCLGLAVAFSANGMSLAAALAMTAALFHVLNHSLFKSLLFFGAGAVLSATGERDLDKLGGLIHRMPATSLFFLVGCVAIAALPPLNGFASEWLMFQAILQSPQLPQWGLKLIVPAVGALLALSAALAAATFVKAFGVTFLGRARSVQAAEARETDRLSLLAMGLLAALCFLAGLLPGVVIDLLAPVTGSLVGQTMPQQSSTWFSLVPIAQSRSSYNALSIFFFIVAAASIAAYAIHRLASRAVRRAPAWGCGFEGVDATMQYSAGSFAQPIRRVFGTVVLRAVERIDMPAPGDTRPARLTVALRDLAWDWLYAPIAAGVQFFADRLNVLQFLTIRRYLSVVFAALVLLLLVLALWP